MALPRLLLRVVDPAQACLDRHLGCPRRGTTPPHREAVVFGPGVPGGSRAAEELLGTGTARLVLGDRTVDARAARAGRQVAVRARPHPSARERGLTPQTVGYRA